LNDDWIDDVDEMEKDFLFLFRDTFIFIYFLARNQK